MGFLGRNQWDGRKFILWFAETFFGDSLSSEEDGSLQEARRRYWNSKAELGEIAAKVAKGDSIPKKDVETKWAQRTTALCSGLDLFEN